MKKLWSALRRRAEDKERFKERKAKALIHNDHLQCENILDLDYKNKEEIEAQMEKTLSKLMALNGNPELTFSTSENGIVLNYSANVKPLFMRDRK